jgi:homeobox protein Nkx-2.1
LLPELSVADLAMSLSPKHHQLQHHQHHQLQQHPHSTPFSVTDILSPMDEFRKVELSGAGSSSSSAGTPAPNPASYVQFPPQYCAPELAAYGDVRGPAAGWYGTASDPRFASECGAVKVKVVQCRC